MAQHYSTHESTDEEHPFPAEYLHNAIANGKGQAVADVDTKAVDTDCHTTYVFWDVVTDDGHSKWDTPCSSAMDKIWIMNFQLGL